MEKTPFRKHKYPLLRLPLVSFFYFNNSSSRSKEVDNFVELPKHVTDLKFNFVESNVGNVSNSENNSLSVRNKVYPNPFNDFIYIINLNQGSYFEVISLHGAKLNSGNLKEGENKIELVDYEKGVYIINIYSIKGEITESHRIIKID